MKKTTQNKLSNRLVKYGALSAAIAGVADASGQIVYTDIADFTGGATVDYNLDLDNDGTADFIIDASSDGSSLYFAVKLNNNSISNNSWLGSQPFYNYPFALDAGNTVSSGQTTWFGGTNVGTLNFVSCYFGSGSSNWCGQTDKYLGLRFQIAGQTHYGWARLDVSASGDAFTVKDYAYNSVPGEAINAGQTLGVADNSVSAIKVVALNKSISLFNLPAGTTYNLYSTSGQSVLKGVTNNDTYVIEAASIATGVYVLELNDTATNAVIRKKVVL